MKKAILVIFCLALLPVAFAQKDNSARDGFIRDTTPPLATLGGVTEGFDDITTLAGDGWAQINNSSPLGTTDWFQGNPAVFLSHAGADDSYIAANFNNTAGSDISNWLITPVVDLGALDSFSFFTRTTTGNTFPDRMEIRISTNGASSDVGATAASVGDFTTLVDSINPNLMMNGYPQDWTEFSYSNLGLSGMGRIAFRYFVTDGGPLGNNSNFIGIDSFTLEEVQCSITSVSLAGNQLTIEGNCAAADIYCFDVNNNPILIAANVAVNGSVTLTISVSPDSLYGAVIAGGDPANAVTTTTRSVPTLGEWGLIIFVIALMSLGLVFMRKRRLGYQV